MTTPKTSISTPRKQTPATKYQDDTPPQTHGFSRQELVDFERAFRLFDIEGTGSIGIGQFRLVLESLLENDDRVYPHLEKILYELSDRANEDLMDFDDYLSLMASTTIQRRVQSQADGDEVSFEHIFNLFDVEGKGFISVEDLQRVAVELGELDMTEEELQEMIDRARSNKSGKVTLKEFSKMMKINLFQKSGLDAGAKDDAPQDSN